ncbi:DEAD/DEAH box helicase family protein [Salicibibacter kimchii]|uniref:DNA helicase n=1 Tax=Salicibibacter kimchii TaxID=2099786 RepID=A0A345C459_9BACI|nr:DEAD/DEAH box helicase family protein [Salicibibacter kimchii]AXF57990.1 DNA helicase [Salicibibacter kimchii]
MTDIRLLTRHLGPTLIKKMEESTSICILTSFVMDSGVRYLAPALIDAADRGAEIKICTGDYLFVTQPHALERLLDLHPNIELRLWQSNGNSFHPKAYLFKQKDKKYTYIGSSNLSHSALNHGVEWNVEVADRSSFYEDALDQFTKTFYASETIALNNESLQLYKERYERHHANQPDTIRQFTQGEEADLMLPEDEMTDEPDIIHEAPATYEVDIKPRFAQIEALAELEKTIEEEYSKALVVMATGLGKTYLAAFFAKRFKRILFIAHLEEILHQAARSFQKVVPAYSTGIYNGKRKESDADVCFASIFTLSMDQHLTAFDPDAFDLIIVDEFHHAAAKTYSKVLEYFNPSFLLGITATPDRNDNKDVYALCDGNVAFRFDFLQAIDRGWLSPFRYFGVYDDTDYSQLTWLGNRYAEDELLAVQLRDSMAERIYDAWKKRKQTKTVAFCSSIRQANFLSAYFQEKGITAISLTSSSEMSRAQAIAAFTSGKIEIIFTVNLFNEGVDIPAIDTLLFVRPTESLTVFTQQLGRGLRLSEGKEHCVVIDLIGNYRNADVKLSVLGSESGRKGPRDIQPEVPSGCEIELDVKVVSLISELKRKKQPRKERLTNDYIAVKQELGRRPTYLELHLQGKSSSVEYRQEYRSYFHFLSVAEELTDREQAIVKRYDAWIAEVEKTGMARSYKMVLLKTMLDRGKDEWIKPITREESAVGFSRYYLEKEHRFREFAKDKTSHQHWIHDLTKTAKKIEEMPMTKWSGSGGDLLKLEAGTFSLNFDVPPEDRKALYEITKEICEYRLHWYFERKG